MRGRELSATCFEDRDDDCTWGCCECRCHDEQEYDLLRSEWVELDDTEDAQP